MSQNERMKFSQTQLAILCLIVANVIWGATAPIFKWTLQDIEPFAFGFWRFFLSALVLLPFTVKHLKLKKQDFSLLIFIAVIGVAFRIAYGLFGLKLAPSINDPIISAAAPIFIIVGSIALFHEKTRKKVVGGAIISLLGIVLIVMQPVFEQDLEKTLLGNIFLIVSMVLYVVYTLFLKQLSQSYRSLTLLFWIFAIAAVTFFPFALFESKATGVPMIFAPDAALGIIFAVLFSTCLAYILHTYAVKHINVSDVGLFTYMDPFVAIAVAGPLLGETVSQTFLIGSILIFIGIFIAENRIHYHPLHLLHPKYRKNDQMALATTEEEKTPSTR